MHLNTYLRKLVDPMCNISCSVFHRVVYCYDICIRIGLLELLWYRWLELGLSFRIAYIYRHRRTFKPFNQCKVFVVY